jgi:hypothetical protein
MRLFIATAAIAFAGAALVSAQGSGGKVEVTGPHICCQQCQNVVAKILGKVDGVSDVSADIKAKTVTFNAKSDASAKAGIKALVDGGFFGSAKVDGKATTVDAAAPAKGTAGDKVTVKDVHVCCGACQKAINKLFDGSKVTYEGKGPQRTVIITGSNLEPSAVVDTLRKAGFNGTP